MQIASSCSPLPAFVLMVCMGNICRSPTAEAVLRSQLAAAGRAHRVQLPDGASAQNQVADGLHSGAASMVVPDPYFGGEAGFEVVFDLVEQARSELVAHASTGSFFKFVLDKHRQICKMSSKSLGFELYLTEIVRNKALGSAAVAWAVGGLVPHSVARVCATSKF